MPPQHVSVVNLLDHLSLVSDLDGHNAFFDDVVDMIPAKFYVPGNTGDEKYNPKYRKGQHKESKESRKARNKQSRRERLDPTKSETTRQAKDRKDHEDDDEANSDVEENSDDEANSDREANSDDGMNPNNSVDIEEKANEQESSSGVDTVTTNTSRIESLRAKLHAKIAVQRAKRPMPESGTISKRAARRAEKLKRIEAAKAKKSSTGHSSASQSQNNKISIPKSKTAPTLHSIEKDLRGIDFGKIAGLSSSQTPHYLDNKSLSSQGKKISLDRMLSDVQKRTQRLQQLKSSTSLTDQQKAKQIQWHATLKEASGDLKRDDPEKIKKAIKRTVKRKEKSQKAWKNRTDKTDGDKMGRQKIRNHNLDQRRIGGAAGANLSKKRINKEEDNNGGGKGNGEKRKRQGPHSSNGRDSSTSRAGFEGKKKEFINGGGGSKEPRKNQ